MSQDAHPPGGGSAVGTDLDLNLVLDVDDRQRAVPGLDRGRLRRLVTGVLAREGVGSAELSIVIVDDAAIREINRTHLGHDWETDVVTFPLGAPDERPLCGELIVSAETARNEAESFGSPVWDEFALYVVHGLLHLLGHDDTSPEAAAAMREREVFHLAAEGLTNTFVPADAPKAGRAVDREDERCTA